MFGYTILFTSLMTIWIILSGYFSLFFIVAGAISCAISVYYARKMDIIDKINSPIYLSPKIIMYYLWLFKEIFFSSLEIALMMWQAKPKVSPTMGWIKYSQKSNVGKATYANSITLTPGTVCLTIDGDEMQIHALLSDNIKNLEDSPMGSKVTGATG